MRIPNRFSKPPRLSEFLLGQVFSDHGTLTTLGDLEEVYHDKLEETGPFRARLWYRTQVLLSLIMFVKNFIQWGVIMFLRTLNFTVRLIKRDKFHYGLNILGLSLGVACCIVIFLFLQHELTYDRHHENSDRIYRIYSTYVTSGEPIRFSGTSPALGPRLKEEFPEVEDYVRIVPRNQMLFIQKEREVTSYEDNIYLADPSLFKIFTYDFIQGNPDTCLDNPRSIVLTESLAKKYFGNEDPLGKTLQMDIQNVLEVTGVIKAPPQNSHLRIEGILPVKYVDPDDRLLEWPMFELFGFTFVLLPQNYDFASFHKKWPAFYEKYCAEHGKTYGQVFQPIFQRLPDIRYDPTPIRGNVAVGSRSYLFAFFTIGIFILLLVCINYINLTTARSATRAKEVGVKKVLGSNRGYLASQLLSESFVLSGLAILLACVIVKAFLITAPTERLFGFLMQIDLLKNSLLLLSLLGLFVFIALASGSYPALYISSFRPVKALSGVLKSGKRGLFIRRILVTSQFVISLGVVVLMLFMFEQINFMRNKNLGFKKENVISFRIQGESTAEKIDTLRQELFNHPGVLSVTNGWNWPGRPSTGLYKFEGNKGIEEHNYYVMFVGFDYLETLGLELVSGRNFDRSHSSDQLNAVIVNETLVKELKWENPIGKRIDQFDFFKGQVIGVVKDFHFRSLHNTIEPLLLRMQPGLRNTTMVLRIDGQNIIQTMGFVEDKWKDIVPNRPFEYRFLDEDFGRLYREDQRQNALMKLFAAICVLISLLGLLGLSSFNSIRRTKEISIRKVHGASATNIVVIMFKEIFVMILIAVAFIFPVTLMLRNMWLNNFAYRTDVNTLVFIGAAIGALLVAFVTASYHCLKIAHSNPAQVLKHE
ncbi:MAG: ABC transporter permease [Candidatus Aminicenantes bacterium]